MANTILVLRFSALGDVALTVPVMKLVAQANPDTNFVVICDQKCADLFQGIERISFHGFDLKKEYKGLFGVIKIFRLIKRQYEFEGLADLHAVLRTHILRVLFFFMRKKVAMIYKGRIEKATITRKENKIFRPLPHTTERYLDVFEKLGLHVNRQTLNENLITVKNDVSRAVKKIGFAPFAKHNEKMYPLDEMLKVIAHFDRTGIELYFFGGGVVEKHFIKEWNKKFKHAISLPGNASIKGEFNVMSSLDLMVTMDSANMHLASLVDVPVLSIWGPTHPFTGFYGYRQHPSLAIQETLDCRPCSVFGNKNCWRGDHACMKNIAVEKIISRVEEMIT